MCNNKGNRAFKLTISQSKSRIWIIPDQTNQYDTKRSMYYRIVTFLTVSTPNHHNTSLHSPPPRSLLRRHGTDGRGFSFLAKFFVLVSLRRWHLEQISSGSNYVLVMLSVTGEPRFLYPLFFTNDMLVIWVFLSVWLCVNH